MQAVIVDIRGKEAAVLNENGVVVRIHNAGYEIGQTIELYQIKPVRSRHTFRRFGTAAAAAVLAAVIGTGMAYAMPYGTVTLDGNPSVEYTINCFDYVLDVKAANEEGENLLDGMDLRNVRHHRVESAISTTMEKIVQNGYLDDPETELQISADTRSDRHTDRLRQELAEVVDRGRINSAPQPERPETEPAPQNMPTEDRAAPEDLPQLGAATDGQMPLPADRDENAPVHGEEQIRAEAAPELPRPEAPGREQMPPVTNGQEADALNSEEDGGHMSAFDDRMEAPQTDPGPGSHFGEEPPRNPIL